MSKKKNTDKQVLETPFGTFRLAKKDVARFKKTVMQLQRTTDSLTRRDIGDWRTAWQMAINVDYPNRQPLYDIYRAVRQTRHRRLAHRLADGYQRGLPQPTTPL